MIFRTGSGSERAAPHEHAPEVALGPPTAVPESAVRAQLERVLASQMFRYSERLSRFLKFVVEQQLAGGGGGLKESVLAVEIFDRETSYDSRVDSVVRVEARRLRDKLDRYYKEEGAQDPVAISLPKGSYAPVFAMRPGLEAPLPPTAVPEALPQTSIKLIVLVAAISVLATLALTRFFAPAGTQAPPTRRLTSDSGLTFQPVLSADGRLVAYASDRSGGGHMDIWVQQIPGGSPRRLTENTADDLDPSFSPDGTLVAYRGEGETDGVYVVPTLGGASTLLARGGYRPRFSPDGSRIAFWTGERMFWTAKIFIVPSTGGAPVPFQPGFRYAAYPVWSPDGRHILFIGSKSPRGNYWESNADDWDWWIAPVAGGPAVRTAAAKVFEQQGLEAPRTGWSHRRILPYHWSASGVVAFSARTSEQTNVWGIRVSSGKWQVNGRAEPLTFGNGRQDHPSMSLSGALAYSALTQKADIWSLPLDANRAEPRGPAVRLTVDAANYRHPVASRDGSRMAFLSNRDGNHDVWVRDLKTGAEKALTSTREDESTVVLSADGVKVAFGYYPPAKEGIFVVPFSGGGRVELCADCGEPRAWLPDGSGLLYQRISPAGRSYIGLLDRSGRAVPLVQSTESALFSPSVSRDGKWLALVVRRPSEHRLMLVPLRDGSAAPEAEWLTVTEAGPWFDKPRWSPDGNVLYYVSDRDGFVCIWASRLDPSTRKPIGAPVPMAHFHGGRHSLRTLYGLELSVAQDKLVFNLGEDSGNIWLAPSAP